MGMAASQARYLSLSARKTNCEYEGQQINQQRLMLSNQSADLFNQMLTMSVPTPPKTTDFTKLQYSWSDGNTVSVIDNYYQLGEPQEDFNYVVTSYHYDNVYTGQRKYLNDPQIQAKKTNHYTLNPTRSFTVKTMSYQAESATGKGDDYYNLVLTDATGGTYNKKLVRADDANVDTVDTIDFIYKRTTTAKGSDATFASASNEWTLPPTGGAAISVNAVGSSTPVSIAAGTTWAATTASDVADLKKSYGSHYDDSKTYYKYTVSSNTFYVCGEDLQKASGMTGDAGNVEIRSKDTTIYYTDGTNYITQSEIGNVVAGGPINFVSATNDPTYSDYSFVGNCELTMIDDDIYKGDQTIDVEIQQLLKDLSSSDGDEISAERLRSCFDANGNYISGSLYMFTLAGKRYFTTPADMDQSLLSAYKSEIADNTIDGQKAKLSYYNSIYVKQKITDVKKALLETDGQGRFSTVKFEDDSVVYTLNVESITDEEAYNDAMNQYYYKQEEYDKRIADINAKTEILQAEDKRLQLKLEQLNTEQSALQTEMEACQKVVSKNVESSFKTFGG